MLNIGPKKNERGCASGSGAGAGINIQSRDRRDKLETPSFADCIAVLRHCNSLLSSTLCLLLRVGNRRSRHSAAQKADSWRQLVTRPIQPRTFPENLKDSRGGVERILRLGHTMFLHVLGTQQVLLALIRAQTLMKSSKEERAGARLECVSAQTDGAQPSRKRNAPYAAAAHAALLGVVVCSHPDDCACWKPLSSLISARRG